METTETDVANLSSELEQFTGSEELHMHWLKRFTYTDGVKWLADRAGAHWLLDLIASHQPVAMRDPMLAEFQIWILRRNETGSGAVAMCFRDTDDKAFEQVIEFTDFPLTEVKLYLENRVLCLPRER